MSTDYRHARVHYTTDYRHARVHYTMVRGTGPGRDQAGLPASDAIDVGGIARALARATPFLRGRLAEAMEMKRIPDLRFVFDAEVVP